MAAPYDLVFQNGRIPDYNEDITIKSPMQKSNICQICHRNFSLGRLYPISMVREPLSIVITQKQPGLDPNGYICFSDLDALRPEHVETVLRNAKEEWTDFEKKVIDTMFDSPSDLDPDAVIETDLTLGQRMADKLATFAGSWTFILIFLATLVIWVLTNAFALMANVFDPYPFVFLNLILSCIAALQAPVIMMSQNRQEQKDRLRAKSDYLVNLKAELQIRQLNAKIDMLISHQWQHLLEIQQIQTEMLQSFRK
jgi:uncharacterized membrane protein